MPFAIAVVLVAACAHGGVTPAFEVRTKDMQAQRTFQVFLTSESDYVFCLSPAFWPNEPPGAMDAPTGVATVRIGERMFPFIAENTGFCPFESCLVRVRPHSTIVATIPYERFDLPPELMNSERPWTLGQEQTAARLDCPRDRV